MLIKVLNKQDEYSAYHIAKAFYPNEEIEVVQDQAGKELRDIYLELKERSKMDMPWGMLTGIRPTKIAWKWIEENPKENFSSIEEQKQSFAKWLYENKFVSEEKAKLAFDIAIKEKKLVSKPWVNAYEKPYALYIGIPFCPSICKYCSFSSGSILSYKDQVDLYLKALKKELDAISKMMIDKDDRPKLPTAIYVGGGTPTSLNEKQLEDLIYYIFDKFVLKCAAQEFTVEAGRPDSITKEKLEILKKFGVNRISINPQSMQQKTLDAIGRAHSVEDVIEKFKIARELKFDNINMDLIMGLEGEDLKDVEDTLTQINELNPESLTVHSLAVKRFSKIGIENKFGKKLSITDFSLVQEMIEKAAQVAKDMEMEPYYLYRQKNIAGNFENVGYAKENKECLYNVLIMEELQSIIAVGAGASTKIVLDKRIPNPYRQNRQETTILRCENVSDIKNYIERVDEMIERKRELLEIAK